MKRKVWDITVKDNPNRVVMGENDEFYTTDTEAYLVFKLDDKNFNPATAVLTLENRNDGSLKNETVDVVDGLIEWEMPQRYIEHFGNWQGQLVYEDTKDGQPELYTSAPFSFVVNAHIGDKKMPSLVEIENWEKFIREGTELIETWEDLEALREENERQRQANYQELLDTGVLQTNINNKLAEAEQEYAPRLTELEQNDENLTAQLAQTEQELNARVSETIANAGDGTIPTEVVDMRTVGGKNYTVAGDALRAIAEGDAIKKGAITPEKISDVHLVDSVNIFDKNKAISGEYYTATDVGDPVRLKTGSNWLRPNVPISVSPGDVVRFNKAYFNVYYLGVDDDGILRQTPLYMDNVGYSEVIVGEGVTKFHAAIYAPTIDEAMITVNNQMPTEYVPHKIKGTKTLDWLEYKPKSVTVEALSDDVMSRFSNNPSPDNPSIVSDWEGKTFVSNGTSISWQDGRAYGGTQDIARGYQTIIKEKLGFSSYLNVGESGKAMADETANGSGIVSTGLKVNYTTHALATIEAGTNDFKLNVQLGDIGSIGDENFDRTTFYGAYRTLIEFILNQNPNIRLVLFTPLQRDKDGYNGWDFVNAAGHTLDDYIKAIFSLGEMYGLPVCDLYANSGFNKFTLSTFTRDGLHPNDVGYARMGGYAAQFINCIGL